MTKIQYWISNNFGQNKSMNKLIN